SELDPQVYPNDLMAETLAPSERRLPSDLDVQILTAVRGTAHIVDATATPAALPRPEAILAAPNDPGWNTRGSATVNGGQLVLHEDARVITELSRTFVVPQNPTTLTFTITSAA